MAELLLKGSFRELSSSSPGFRDFYGLRGSLPKSGPLDFATKNTFALFFVGEEALVGVN